MADELLKIYLGDKTKDMFKRAGNISQSLADTLRVAAVKAVKDTGTLALASYKSKIPIDTLELRGTSLDNGFLRGKSTPYTFIVEMRDGIHYGADKKPKNSIELSDLLNTSGQHRSKTSASIGYGGVYFSQLSKGTPTAAWQEKAESSFNNALSKYLSTYRISI